MGPPGGKGTRTGKVFEMLIKTALEENGYEILEQKNIGKALFGNIYKADFVVKMEDGKDVIISCKWQQIPGTAEQKLLYEIASLIKIIRNSNNKYKKAYIVLGGGGFSPKAKEYLLSQRFREVLKDGDLIEVIDTDEVISRINKKEL